MTLPASGPLAMTDIQTEFGGTNPIGLNEYYAGGGLVPSGTSGTYGAVPSSGALSIQNFYGTSNYIPVYIEELFSTYLYKGTDPTSPVINNGIDLSTEGGLIWIKNRDAAGNHYLVDTERGANKVIYSNLTNAQSTEAPFVFNTDGFTVPGNDGNINGLNVNYASWTFRKQPKFFDVVTYTGNGVSGRQIAHSLGSAPGCVIVKMLTDSGYSWQVYHRGLTSAAYRVELDTTIPETTTLNPWVSTAPTASVFTVSNSLFVNGSGKQYVAYLFAHDAGGFGLTGTDNVISCRSVTSTAGGTIPTVDLGFEPQWILYKNVTSAWSWEIWDNMRGWSISSNGNATANALKPNLSNEESIGNTAFTPTGTGFYSNANFGASQTYIYIAIRRGPMEVPTLGTSVFDAQTYAGNNTLNRIFNFSMAYSDLSWFISRNYPSAPVSISYLDRLRGEKPKLWTAGTSNESTSQANVQFSNMEKIKIATEGSFSGLNESGSSFVLYNLKRAPGFFDEVCYTGTGSATTQAHNLGVAPELMIVKSRSFGSGWRIYSPAGSASKVLDFTTGALADNSTYLDGVSPTASVFTVGGAGGGTNNSAETYVAYLYATCPGVSKVGSFTGTGATQVINCGFTGGARFVLIKRTNSTGDWYVWDSARGIVAGNDPYLTLNTTAAEVTSTDWVDTAASGFELSNAGGNLANSNGGTYIFLAIA